MHNFYIDKDGFLCLLDKPFDFIINVISYQENNKKYLISKNIFNNINLSLEFYSSILNKKKYKLPTSIINNNFYVTLDKLNISNKKILLNLKFIDNNILFICKD